MNAVVLFDGDCGLCTGAVRFLVARDPRGHLRFRALNDPQTRAWLAARGWPNPPDSLLLLEGDLVRVRSEAALRICRRLRAPWPLLEIFRILPLGLRDFLYDAVARRRIRWFGRPAETCDLTQRLSPDRIWEPGLSELGETDSPSPGAAGHSGPG